MDPHRLTEDELAERSGTSRERIKRLVDLGILRPDQDTFARRDVISARVVTKLHAIGIETEALATALASGHLTLARSHKTRHMGRPTFVGGGWLRSSA